MLRGAFGRSIASRFVKSMSGVSVTYKRNAGGYNSKFNFEKPWDEKKGDYDPFYVYDPHFKNESTVPTHDELNMKQWGVWDDPDVTNTQIVVSWLCVIVFFSLVWQFVKRESTRMYPYFMDEPEIPDEVIRYQYGASYYELRDKRIGYPHNMRPVPGSKYAV